MLWRGPLSGYMRQWADDCSIGIFLNSKDGFLRSCSSREGRCLRFRSGSHTSTPISVWGSMLFSPSTTHSTRSHGESLSKATLEDSCHKATLVLASMPFHRWSLPLILGGPLRRRRHPGSLETG